jgi:hypothetical protein
MTVSENVVNRNYLPVSWKERSGLNWNRFIRQEIKVDTHDVGKTSNIYVGPLNLLEYTSRVRSNDQRAINTASVMHSTGVTSQLKPSS